MGEADRLATGTAAAELDHLGTGRDTWHQPPGQVVPLPENATHAQRQRRGGELRAYEMAKPPTVFRAFDHFV